MTLWTGSGLFNIEPGQVVMIAIGLLLLFLAIRKGFEPLLLVPIGFGGILANIPEAGLAFSAVENAVHFAKPQVLEALAGVVGALSGVVAAQWGYAALFVLAGGLGLAVLLIVLSYFSRQSLAPSQA